MSITPEKQLQTLVEKCISEQKGKCCVLVPYRDLPVGCSKKDCKAVGRFFYQQGYEVDIDMGRTPRRGEYVQGITLRKGDGIEPNLLFIHNWRDDDDRYHEHIEFGLILEEPQERMDINEHFMKDILSYLEKTIQQK